MLSVELARTALPRLRDKCRTYPVHVRAGFPFDTRDPADMEAWLLGRPEESGDIARYEGTRSFILRNLDRDVVEAIRSAGGRPSRGRKKKPLRLGLDVAADEEQGQRRRRAESQGPVSLEEISEVIASALVHFAGGPEPDQRLRQRSITCLGKVYALVYARLDEGAAEQLVTSVISSTPFMRLGVSEDELRVFEEKVRQFRAQPDIRQALNKAGLPCPRATDWEAFWEVFMVIYTGKPAPRRGARRKRTKDGVK
jgi:hypothetical protein